MSDTTFDNAVPVQPFWLRMPKIFALPLSRPVLTRIVTLSVLALASPLLLWLLGGFGLLLMPVLLLALLVYGIQYGFTIIDRSSQGFLDPATYPPINEHATLGRPFKYVAINMIFGLVVVAVAVFSKGSDFLTWTASLVLFGLALPAAVMRLVSTGTLSGALSPGGMAETILRIGKPYLALCVFVFFADLCRTYGVVAVGAAGGLTGMVVGAMAGQKANVGPAVFGVLLAMSVAFWYFTYVICALIGYAMYQHADVLEIIVIGPGEAGRGGRKVDVRARTRDAMIGKLVAAGDIPGAIQVVNDELRERPQDLSLHARLHRLLLLEGYVPRIDDHTERYIEMLIRTNNEREALPLVEEALARNAKWEPRNTDYVVPLAKAALTAGKPALATQLIRGFDKRHQRHPDVPQVYLIGAQIMLTSGEAGAAQAQRILEHLLAKYEHHPAAEEGRRMLERMAQLVARKPV